MHLRSSKRSNAYTFRALIAHSESSRNLPAIKKSISLLDEIASGLDFRLKPFPRKGISDDDLLMLVHSRIINPDDKDARVPDSFAIRDFEKRILKDEASGRGVPYEAAELMRFYRKYIAGADMAGRAIHVIITERLLMSWSEDDLRFHARAAIFGIPCIISLSGLVEGPARPQEYYIEKQAIGSLLAENISLLERYAGRFLESDDDRIPEVLRGYLMQCAFYAMIGWPFCEERDCILFNAHWQEEMLRAQVESGRLCERHQKILSKQTRFLRKPS